MNEQTQTQPDAPTRVDNFVRRISVRIDFSEMECGTPDESRHPNRELRFEQSIQVDDMDASAICQEAQELFDELVARLERNLRTTGGVL